MATGDCCASISSTDFSMPVVARVDLVVERDHLVAQLDVLRLERVDRAADRAEDDVALLLEARLEGVEARLELDCAAISRSGP